MLSVPGLNAAINSAGGTCPRSAPLPAGGSPFSMASAKRTAAPASSCPRESRREGRWPPLLLSCLQDGIRRFDELRRCLATLSHHMLTLELRKFEQVIKRTARAGYPSPRGVHAHARGAQAAAVIVALGDWWTPPERAAHV